MADRTPDPESALREEVRARLGLVPSFFCVPAGAPAATAAVWAFARSAYLDNPLPSLLKERLFVSLSRFCPTKYCVARHAGFLLGLGRPAGDPAAHPHTVDGVVRLLRQPFPRGPELGPVLARLTAARAAGPFPPGSPLEDAAFAAAAHTFLQTSDAAAARDALAAALGDDRSQNLLLLLTYVRAAHLWSATQPGVRLEEDVTRLLAEHDRLADALWSDPPGWAGPVGWRPSDELTALRRERDECEELARTQHALRKGEEESHRRTKAALAEREAELRRTAAEQLAARKAALNLMEDAILARDAVRASEARQTFLLRLSDAIRPLADPLAIEAEAARLLGEFLGAGRAFCCEVEPDEDHVVVRRDYTAAGVASFAGRYRLSDFGPAWAAGYRAGRTLVTPDVRDVPGAAAAAFDAPGVRACVGVPVLRGGRLAGVLVVHSVAPRAWTPVEVGLLEATAERTWAAVERARTEAALAAEKEYAESIVQALREPLLVLRPDLTVQSVNPAFYTHFRVDPADTVGRQVYELDNRQWNIPALRTLLEDVLPDSNVFDDYQVAHEFEGLGRRVMLVNGRRLDHVQLILLGIRDITERARAEAALAAELDAMTRLRELSDRLLAAPDLPAAMGEVLDAAIALHGADLGTVQVYDPAAGGRRYAATRGFDPAALAAVPPVDRDSHPTCAAALRSGQPVIAADIPTDPRFADHVAAAAALGYRAAFSFPLTTRRGEFLGVLTVHFRERREPTERELRWADLYAPLAAHLIQRARDEHALRASEERLRAVAANLPNGAAFVVDHDLRYALAGGQALGPAGFTAADLEGKALADVLPPELAAEYTAHFRRVLAGQPFRAEHASHGRHYVTHGVPLRDAAGAVTAALAVSYDITDRVTAEEGLARTEERLRQALAAARMGTWHWDVAADVHTRDANLNRLLGLDAVETRLPLTEFFAHAHLDDRARVRAAFDESVRSGRPLNLEFRVVRLDGVVRWLRDQGDVFGPADGPRMSGACMDVTDLKEAEAAVRGSDERLRLILESATDHAIFTLAADRVVTSWSPGAAAVFGWPEAEAVGRSGDELFTPEDRAAGAPQAEAEAARRDGRAADERWHVRRDGTRFWASGALTPLGADPARGFVKVLRDLTDRKRVEDALRAAHLELERRVAERTAELAAALASLEAEMDRRRALARQLSTAQEAERRRVARDLHDTVGQTLTGLGLAVAAVGTAGPLPAAAVERLARVRELADALGRELHEVAVRLRPTALDDVGLAAAARQLTAVWAQQTGVPVDFAAGLEGRRLPAEVETALYRVVQEALTNAAKYARASRVSVVLGVREGEAVAVVEDDGTGFDPDAPRAPAPGRAGGLGLPGMRERVELLGGSVEVESAPGQGTTVIARIPLQ